MAFRAFLLALRTDEKCISPKPTPLSPVSAAGGEIQLLKAQMLQADLPQFEKNKVRATKLVSTRASNLPFIGRIGEDSGSRHTSHSWIVFDKKS